MKSPYILGIEEIGIREALVSVTKEIRVAEILGNMKSVDKLSVKANTLMLKLRENFRKQNG